MSKKILIDAEIIEMCTAKGFSDIFWRELRERRKEDPFVSNEKIFDEINARFEKAIGRKRYSSYQSFMKVKKNF